MACVLAMKVKLRPKDLGDKAVDANGRKRLFLLNLGGQVSKEALQEVPEIRDALSSSGGDRLARCGLRHRLTCRTMPLVFEHGTQVLGELRVSAKKKLEVVDADIKRFGGWAEYGKRVGRRFASRCAGEHRFDGGGELNRRAGTQGFGGYLNRLTSLGCQKLQLREGQL